MKITNQIISSNITMSSSASTKSSQSDGAKLASENDTNAATTTYNAYINESIQETNNRVFGSRTDLDSPYLFQDTSKQSFMGKEKPSLFSVTDEKSYYEQMCLTLPNLWGDDPTVYLSGLQYEYDKSDFDFSVTGPDGTKLYTKPDDGGSHNIIAVIDCFDVDKETEIMYVDDAQETPVAHGEFVASLIESQVNEKNLGYTVDRFDVDITDGALVGGVETLDYIMQNIDDYRAINLSICEYCDYDTVSAAILENVTPENLADYKEKIMTNVMSDEVTELYEMFDCAEGYLPDLESYVEDGTLTQEEADQTYALLILRYKVENVGEFYAKADAIAEAGVPVFMAAGNYDDMFNFGALLTENVEYVGATADIDPTIEDTEYAKNSLVTRYGTETFTGNNVINGKIDVDGNGSGDIDADGIDTDTFYATGTSFASPWTLVKALEEADSAEAEIKNQELENYKNSLNIFELQRYSRVGHNNFINQQNQTTYSNRYLTNRNISWTSSSNTGTGNASLSNNTSVKKTSQKNDTPSYITNQSILNDLDSNINYNTSGTKQKLTYEEAKEDALALLDKLNPKAYEAGTNYYTYGSGSAFRYELPDMTQDKYYGKSFEEVKTMMQENPIR